MSALDALQQLGTSHAHADVATRERMAHIVARLAADAQRLGVPHLVLATCNRYELYWFGDLALAAATVPLAEGMVQHRVGEQAMAHLLAVAAGRASMVPGETEVLGQVRRAWLGARQSGACVGDLDLCMRLAIAAARRIRRDAPFTSHHASIASTGVALALRAVAAVAPRVVIIGAGEAAQATAESVRATNSSARITVVARRADRAAAVAESVGGVVRAWSALTDVIGQSALVIAATGARQPLVGAAQLRTRRPGLVLLDLGLPRNIDPLVRTFSGVTLVDLDDIGRLDVAGRDDAWLAAVDQCLACELDRVRGELDGRTLPGVLSDLHASGEAVAMREAGALSDVLGLTADGDRALVQAAVQRAVRRALFPASRALRGASIPLG